MRGLVSSLVVITLVVAVSSWGIDTGRSSTSKYDSYRSDQSKMNYDTRGTTSHDSSRSGTMKSSDISSRDQIGAGQTANLNLIRCDQIIGHEVRNLQDQEVGEVNDVVLTPSLDKVSYIAIGHGGFMAMGKKLFAIPVSELSINSDGKLILPVTNDQLNQSQGFSRANWPSEASSDWLKPSQPSQGVTHDVTGAMKNETHIAMGTANDLENRRVSRILGMQTRNAADENLADIQDVVFNARDGQLAYCIVSLDRGFMNKGQLAAIPWSAVNIQPDMKVARVDTTLDDLRAIAFAPNNYPDLADRTYASSIHDRFRGQDWQTFGYVGEGHPSTTSAEGAKGTDENLTRDFSADFKPDRIETISGDIVHVGTHSLGANQGEGTWVTLRTDDGKTCTVQLAPSNYLREHKLVLREGDKLSVTGSKVREGDTPVYIATKVTYNDQTYNLRDEHGKPLFYGGMTGSHSKMGTENPDIRGGSVGRQYNY